mmetsp:Transcript_36483/g.53507  ORF Transcript_36483/g.53507 Transcript_36483/m.53507 type:complete len:201 (+) Transcript_36483:3338-3940(+)
MKWVLGLVLQLLQYLLLCYLLHRHPHSPLCSPQESNPDHHYLPHNSLDPASLQHLQPGRAARPHSKHARPPILRQCLVPCALCCRAMCLGILPLRRTRSVIRVFVLLPCVWPPGLLHIEGMALECGRLRHVWWLSIARGLEVCGTHGGTRQRMHMQMELMQMEHMQMELHAIQHDAASICITLIHIHISIFYKPKQDTSS